MGWDNGMEQGRMEMKWDGDEMGWRWDRMKMKPNGMG